VSEPDFEVLTQGGLLVNSSVDGGITVVEFERIMRAQLTLHVQACTLPLNSAPASSLSSFSLFLIVLLFT
jgi:hypothetical protein